VPPNSPNGSAAEAARRKVNRAAGLLRDAAAELAALVSDDVETVGIVRVHDVESLEDARQTALGGLARHGMVDVVVIARPRTRRTPTTARERAKGADHHGNRNARAAAP